MGETTIETKGEVCGRFEKERQHHYVICKCFYMWKVGVGGGRGGGCDGTVTVYVGQWSSTLQLGSPQTSHPLEG